MDDCISISRTDWAYLVDAMNHFQWLYDVGALTREEQKYIETFEAMRGRYGLGT